MKSFVVSIALSVLAVGSSALADPHPLGMQAHNFNGPVAPVTEGGVTTFHIDNHGCSDRDYGDGRGESDCRNGNVRSTLGGIRDQRVGETIGYSFDIQIEPGFAYEGFYNDHSEGFLAGGWDSRLRIASWEGENLHNFLYMLKLDARNGITFLGEICVPPERLSEWNSFSMQVRWAGDERGWIKVACNGEVIYLGEGVATNQAPHCYITNQCEPGHDKNPGRFTFILGPVMAGFGPEWQMYGKPSQFTEIQPEGITIRMRNVELNEGGSLYSEEDREIVRRLQAHLNALGCDVGPADGEAGPRTRAAALSCREFAEGTRPSALNVGNVREILELYETHHPAER